MFSSTALLLWQQIDNCCEIEFIPRFHDNKGAVVLRFDHNLDIISNIVFFLSKNMVVKMCFISMQQRWGGKYRFYQFKHICQYISISIVELVSGHFSGGFQF